MSNCVFPGANCAFLVFELLTKCIHVCHQLRLLVRSDGLQFTIHLQFHLSLIVCNLRCARYTLMNASCWYWFQLRVGAPTGGELSIKKTTTLSILCRQALYKEASSRGLQASSPARREKQADLTIRHREPSGAPLRCGSQARALHFQSQMLLCDQATRNLPAVAAA